MSPKPQTQPPADKESKIMTYKAFGSDVDVKLSVQIVRQFFTKPTKNGVQASDADCMKFMLLCQAGALNPAEKDAFLVGYDGRDGAEFSMTVAHSAFLKRAEANEQNNGMESGVIVLAKNGDVIERQGDFYLDGEKVVGGWAKVYRKDVERPYVSKLRTDSRKKDNKFWNGDTAGMIVKCAEADALRQAFPTKLGALYIENELREPDLRDVTPKRTAARAVPLDPVGLPSIEAPSEDVEQAEGNPVFDDFLLSLADVNTAADLESYRVQCAEFEKESERTIAHAAVAKQAESLGLKWNGADYVTA